jgi:Domain of unknown function (DUF4328)
VNDIWVCDACRSINRRRDDLCYSCGAPRSSALDTPTLDLRADSAARERGARSYVASWPLALVTVALLAAVTILGIVMLRVQASEYPAMRQAFVDAITSGRDTVDQAMTTGTVPLGLVSLVRTGLALLAVLCLAGWLGLVTRNVPLLGGGTPSRSPLRVFGYTLIPVWNLIRVPGMLQDLLYRVDPDGGGAFMVLAAWIGLVGSYLLSVVGGWAITWAGVRALIPQVEAGDINAVVQTFGGILDQAFWLNVVVAVMVAAGTVLLAVLLIRVEVRCAARDREIQAQMAASGAAMPPTGPDWQRAASAAVPAPDEPAPAAPVSAPPRTATPAPYEPNWPASRPWPGSPDAGGPSGATDPSDARLAPSWPPMPPPPTQLAASPSAPLPAPPDEAPPGPPPPPSGAPRLG